MLARDSLGFWFLGRRCSFSDTLLFTLLSLLLKFRSWQLVLVEPFCRVSILREAFWQYLDSLEFMVLEVMVASLLRFRVVLSLGVSANLMKLMHFEMISLVLFSWCWMLMYSSCLFLAGYLVYSFYPWWGFTSLSCFDTRKSAGTLLKLERYFFSLQSSSVQPVFLWSSSLMKGIRGSKKHFGKQVLSDPSSLISFLKSLNGLSRIKPSTVSGCRLAQMMAVHAPIDLPQRMILLTFISLRRWLITHCRSQDSLKPKEMYQPPLSPLPEQSNRQTLNFALRSPLRYCSPSTLDPLLAWRQTTQESGSAAVLAQQLTSMFWLLLLMSWWSYRVTGKDCCWEAMKMVNKLWPRRLMWYWSLVGLTMLVTICSSKFMFKQFVYNLGI